MKSVTTFYSNTLFYRTLNVIDEEFNLNKTQNNNLPEELLLNIEDSKPCNQLKSDNCQLKPLGDITITLEDIIPRMYSIIYLI